MFSLLALFLQIIFLGNATLFLDGNLLNIMYRRDLSTLTMSLFSRNLVHLETNLDKRLYFHFYSTQLYQIYYYSV